MRTALAPSGRLAMAIALPGVTAIGAVALAPAAMAEEAAAAQPAPAIGSAPEVARGPDMPAAHLDQRAHELIEQASEKKCLDAPAGGGRF